MDIDKDRLKDLKDTVSNAVNQYTEERREAVDELAEYGGGGPEGYAFAALVLSQRYEEAAELIDEDPATIEQDVGPTVDDLYDDARQGREQASTLLGEALEAVQPLAEAYRKDGLDPSSLEEAAKEVKDNISQRATQYAVESAMKQAEDDLEELFGGFEDGEDPLGDVLGDLEDGDLEDLFDVPDDVDDPVYDADETSDEVDYEPDETADADDPSYESDESSDADDAEDEVEDDPSAFPVDPRTHRDDADDDEE